MKKNILIGHDDFKRLFIDNLEDKYFPIVLNPFNKEAYVFLRDLEKTFYKEDNGEKLMFFLESPLGMLNLGEARGKKDGLRSTAIYVVTNILPFNQPLFILIQKEEHTKKRLQYLFDTYKIKSSNIETGPNKNYLKTHKNNMRNPIDSRLRHEVFKRDGYKCVECGATNKEKILHADHIIPVSQEGSDELNNLQTLCEDCNLIKSNKKWEGGTPSFPMENP